MLPIDVRLPEPVIRQLMAAARPTCVHDGDGLRRLHGAASDDRLGLVVATSGASGRPKLVELDRAAVEAAVHAGATRIGATTDDPWLACLSPAHIGGMLVYLRALLIGAPLVHLDPFDPAQFARAPATFASIVPTMLHRLAQWTDLPLGSYRAILVGGDSVTPAQAEVAATRGMPLVATYGLSETCGGVVYDGAPLDGVEVRIGEAGEVLLRGATLMRGYRFDPAGNAAVIDPAGWLHTGDAGRFVDGKLVVIGRLDNLIRSGAEKVWPEPIEAVLRALRDVTDAAVVGVPDPEWGQRVVAILVPLNPRRPPRLGVLRDAVLARLPAAYAPRELRLVTGLARTSTGKLDRRAVAEMAMGDERGG